jgi:hypothetical protein
MPLQAAVTDPPPAALTGLALRVAALAGAQKMRPPTRTARTERRRMNVLFMIASDYFRRATGTSPR